MHIASRYGQSQIINWLIKHADKSFAREKTLFGTTSMHFACASGSFECVSLLLELLPETIDEKTFTGLTPLFLAIQENRMNIVLLLSDYGANFMFKTEDGRNLIHVCSQLGHLDILRWLIKNKNIDINEKDTGGATALHVAASNGHAQVVQFLLEENADISVDSFGGLLSDRLSSWQMVGPVFVSRCNTTTRLRVQQPA
jgi:ankyrin repeat protein